MNAWLYILLGACLGFLGSELIETHPHRAGMATCVAVIMVIGLVAWYRNRSTMTKLPL